MWRYGMKGLLVGSGSEHHNHVQGWAVSMWSARRKRYKRTARSTRDARTTKQPTPIPPPHHPKHHNNLFTPVWACLRGSPPQPRCGWPAPPPRPHPPGHGGGGAAAALPPCLTLALTAQTRRRRPLLMWHCCWLWWLWWLWCPWSTPGGSCAGSARQSRPHSRQSRTCMAGQGRAGQGRAGQGRAGQGISWYCERGLGSKLQWKQLISYQLNVHKRLGMLFSA